MREFQTDRPDVTEGPFTVDAGHVQTESDIFNYSRSKPDEIGTVTEKFLFGSTNVRLGVTNDTEVDFLLQPYNAVRTRFADPPQTVWKSGPDTFELRAKYNLYGNDTFKTPGSTAMALLPFVDIPTARNGVGQDRIEGGLIVPFALKLTDKADLSLMTEFDLRRNASGAGYHVEYVNTASLSYDITDNFGTYMEVVTIVGNGGPLGGIVVLDGGWIYKMSQDLQLDAGIRFGVTRAANRLNPFIGISRRF